MHKSKPSPHEDSCHTLIIDRIIGFQHDLNQGRDSSSLYVSGGGTYTFIDGIYTENLEYCNFREYENNSFSFEVSIMGDTLIQRGEEVVEEAGVDKYILETYIRLVE